MPTIRITAKPGVIAPFSAPAFGGWRGDDGKDVLAMPVYDSEGNPSWDIPDQPANRSRIRAEFEPSGNFDAELVHVSELEGFSFGASAPVDAQATETGEVSTGVGKPSAKKAK